MTTQGKIPRSATKNNLDLLIQLLKNKTNVEVILWMYLLCLRG